jgi:hypothetical protein
MADTATCSISDMNRYVCTVFIVVTVLFAAQLTKAQTFGLRWYKGNTHTHTLNSDGDSSPADVAEWYKKNGYDFLFITDHEHITAVDELNAKLGDNGKFLLIQGQEVTDRFDKKPYHVNGLGLGKVVLPQRGTTIVSNVQKNVDAVRAAGGLPQINHPNFGWALTASDIAQIKNAALLEIYSGHPLVNMAGGGGVPSVESMWDTVLTGGMVIYAVAVDDVHHIKRLGDRSAATPGHGWVVVRATELTPPAILSALERGDFYASSGVELEDYEVTPSEIRVKIKAATQRKYTTLFIGAGGKILQTSIGLESVYRRKKSEKYVRVKVIDSNGMMAWTQPAFSKRT